MVKMGTVRVTKSSGGKPIRTYPAIKIVGNWLSDNGYNEGDVADVELDHDNNIVIKKTLSV